MKTILAVYLAIGVIYWITLIAINPTGNTPRTIPPLWAILLWPVLIKAALWK